MGKWLLGILLLWTLGVAAQQRYSDAANHFSLEVPAGWNSQAGSGNTVLTLNGSGTQVVIVRFEGLSLEKAVTLFSGELEKVGARHQESRTVRIHEVPGHISAWKRGETLVLSTVLVSGNEGFAILGETTVGNQAPYIAMLNTFRVERATVAAQKTPVSPASDIRNHPDYPRQEDFGNDF